MSEKKQLQKRIEQLNTQISCGAESETEIEAQHEEPTIINSIKLKSLRHRIVKCTMGHVETTSQQHKTTLASGR